MKCKVLIHSSKDNKDEWIDGEIVGIRIGDSHEDFDRLDVETNDGIYEGCHPECVKVI